MPFGPQENLYAHIGESFEHTETLDEETISAFARLIGDLNLPHHDRVAAVVKGYRNEGFPVLKEKDLQNPSAKAYEDLWTCGNSAIVVGYSIQHIVEAIRKDAVERKR